MRILTRITVCTIALLIAVALAPQTAQAEWDDGSWHLDFKHHTEKQQRLDVLILLEGESGFVQVATERESFAMELSARELPALLKELDDAGFDLTFAESRGESLYLQLVLM